MPFVKEANALVAIAFRDIWRFIKSPGSVISAIVFSIISLGVMGGSLSQNLAGDLGYNFLQFVLVGMIALNLFMGTMSGVTSLMAEREVNLTQELFVSPISRCTIILGKMIGSGFGSILTLISVPVVALFMHIPLGGIQIVRLIMIVPAICLVGTSFGVFFIGFVQDSKVAQMGAMVLVMPQMFLAGTIVPISHSTGVLALLAKIMPLTYLTDLTRGVFYWGEPVYSLVVLRHPLFNIAVMAVFFLVFYTVGTTMYAKSEQSR